MSDMTFRITGLLILSLFISKVQSQVYHTRTAIIQFSSKTPLEDIYAENKQVYAAVDLSKKTIAFSMLLKGFLFKKALMQEHFNENYVESDKYPKASFSGSFNGEISEVANKSVTVTGKINIHGVEKDLSVTASLQLREGQLQGESDFKLVPEDFNIRIPGLVRDKIAKEINVRVQMIGKLVK